MSNCWIIAGALSGIAKAFAYEVAAKGDQLILLGRDSEKLIAMQSDLKIRFQVTVNYLLFDAVAFDTHREIATAAVALAQSPISAMIAFGWMPASLAISHTLEEVVKTIEINFTGSASILYALLPHFQKQQSGGIVVLGSVAGDSGRPKNFDYGAAKAGLSTFCEGLRMALQPHHVSVTLMKLGYIDTPMTYGRISKKIAASPVAAAKACLRAVEKNRGVYYFPGAWRLVMWIVRCMPNFVLRRI
ncbi:MAG: hypothetical protein A3I77_06680 [Gammaproteobacteria bacterium RIFCSPLOWO2_02_FULL_42_14]|nr:MAG: hypothetical protein A3B71_02520 [Gammaproteobacteria bacterium RIFCSPHIGHO2_02_FULL_42_43]OGT28882.1 MAG: hypothetical protein A2624_06895 [Gammaproteobacteria bacterium RIFCSPHIGHO2_01_FULL_42_8]OGT51949.1 MAG: hypothetical protein A3E54_04020 [Gammaproteobacteria bacterium RIFCSPHIGHO2_12_FULL_41_25]OGT61054.1 MAG: hypothetical protein A3I77_06680 [Gammaproteobacteria bacterium RIFCSPLOWO2_02_FULL_42_14]OGT86981.1 MAG: hypothetical protein A3G86_00400 [Gammaproteobacteria bacterium R